MSPSEHDVRIADGRTLRVLEDGDPRGLPVLVLHGGPGCRFLYAKHVQDATRRGIRLIGHDRPGYGASTPQPGRRIVDEAADVVAIADALGLSQFAVWGHSAGGAPALACAAALPDRVVAAASLAAVAPYPAAGLDWSEGMGEANAAEFNLMLNDQPAWEAMVAENAVAMKNATPDQLAEILSTLLSEVDRAAQNKELTEFLQNQMREGLRLGGEGWKEDALAGMKPWGFEFSVIQVPLQLWHGAHDRFVPFSHGQWLATQLPRAEHHLEPDEGHITLFERRIPAVHQWLASHF